MIVTPLYAGLLTVLFILLGLRVIQVRQKGIPLGVNVESVSIRKAEIDASVRLVQTLRGHMRRSLGG